MQHTTHIALTNDQLYAVAAAIDMALDSIYQTQQSGYSEPNPNYLADTAKQMEAVSAILGEKMLALQS